MLAIYCLLSLILKLSVATPSTDKSFNLNFSFASCDSVGKVSEVYSYFFSGISCIHTMLDVSSLESERLYAEIELEKTVIVGNNIQRSLTNAYIISTENERDVRRMVELISPQTNDRILLIYLNNTVNPDTGLLGNAEVFKIEMTSNSVYELDQPILKPRKFKLTSRRAISRLLLRKWPDCHGRRMRAQSYHCPPFSYYTKDYTDGIEMVIIKELSKLFNFVLDLEKYNSTDVYGFQHENGSFSGGLLGELIENRADLAFCTIWFKLSLREYVDFSWPYVQPCVTLLVPRPVPLVKVWTGIYSPYEERTWLLLVLTIFCFSTVACWLAHFSQSCGVEKTRHNTFYICLMDAVGLLCLTSSPPENHLPTAVRHLFNGWSVLALLVTTAYSCQLVKHLTMDKYTPRLDSVEEVVKAGITWGEIFESEFIRSFQGQDYWYDALFKNFRVDHDAEERNRRIKDGKHAIIGQALDTQFSYIGYPIQEELLATMRVMKDCMGRHSPSFAFQKSSPLTDPTSWALLRMFEGGILSHIEEMVTLRRESTSMRMVFKELDGWDECPEGVPLDLKHLGGAFLALVIGYLLALLTFIEEIVADHIVPRNRRCGK